MREVLPLENVRRRVLPACGARRCPPCSVLLLVLLSAVTCAQKSSSRPDFFPIVVSLQAPYNIQAYRNMGVNVYYDLSWGPLDAYHLDLLHKYGMYVICGQDSFSLAHRSDTLIYGWSIPYDEPDNAQWNASTQQYDSCLHPDLIINLYRSLKAVDATRPVLLTLGQGVANLSYIGRGPCHEWLDSYPIDKHGYLEGCDICAFDIYPVNSTINGITGNLWYVAKGMDSLSSWSRGSGKPMWAWIETTKISAASAAKPTPSQVRSEVWMALVHGAKGIGYFTHTWDPGYISGAVLLDTPMVASLTNLNAQIRTLAPVLNSPTVRDYTTITSSNPNVPVDAMVKEYGGAMWLFAVAMRNGTTRATFTVPAGSDVEVIGEARSISVSDTVFSDDFASYGVHLYKITASISQVPSGATSAAPVVRVYPNPASGRVFIDSPAMGRMHVSLYRLSGECVAHHDVSCNGEGIDITTFATGLYLLRVEGTNWMSSAILIKQ